MKTICVLWRERDTDCIDSASWAWTRHLSDGVFGLLRAVWYGVVSWGLRGGSELGLAAKEC